MVQIQMSEVPMSDIEALAQRNKTIEENNRIAIEESKAFVEQYKAELAARKADWDYKVKAASSNIDMLNEGVDERNAARVPEISDVPPSRPWKQDEMSGPNVPDQSSLKEQEYQAYQQRLQEARDYENSLSTEHRLAVPSMPDAVPALGYQNSNTGRVPDPRLEQTFGLSADQARRNNEVYALNDMHTERQRLSGGISDRVTPQIGGGAGVNLPPALTSPNIDADLGRSQIPLTLPANPTVPPSIGGLPDNRTPEEIRAAFDARKPISYGMGPTTTDTIKEFPWQILRQEQRFNRLNIEKLNKNIEEIPVEIDKLNAESKSILKKLEGISPLNPKYQSLNERLIAIQSNIKRLKSQLVEDNITLSAEIDSTPEINSAMVDLNNDAIRKELERDDLTESQRESLTRQLVNPEDTVTPEEQVIVDGMEAADIQGAEVAAEVGNSIIKLSYGGDSSETLGLQDLSVPYEVAKGLEDLAKEEPKSWRKAIDWFTDIMGIQGKDLIRMGIFYIGSRVAGSSHSGAMKFSLNAAMAGVASRDALVQRLQESGKWTNKSINLFEKSSDYEDLKEKVNGIPFKVDKNSPEYYWNAKTFSFDVIYPAEDKNGTFYVDYSRNRVKLPEGAEVSELSPADQLAEFSKEGLPVVKKVIDSAIDSFKDSDNELSSEDKFKLKSDLADFIAGSRDFYRYSGKSFDLVDLNRIAETAAELAIRSKKYSIFHHMEDATILLSTETWSDAFKTVGKNGEVVIDTETYLLLKDKILNEAGEDPSAPQAASVAQQLFAAAYKDYMSDYDEDKDIGLTHKRRQVFIDKSKDGSIPGATPFMVYLMTNLN
jgi:hypothetical protein